MPNDIEILYALAKIESQVTADIGLDLLENIRQIENYVERLTLQDKGFLLSLQIAVD
jgi:pyridoxine 5'-phosphate synthase PdxJ